MMGMTRRALGCGAALAVAVVACKHPPGAEQARECVQAFVAHDWPECTAAGAHCATSEVEVDHHDGPPDHPEMTVTTTVTIHHASGVNEDRLTRFQLDMIPQDNGESACGQVHVVAAPATLPP